MIESLNKQELVELLNKRHSVRRYKEKEISQDDIEKLNNIINNINNESGFNFQMKINEPTCFNGNRPHYGKFKNVCNYFILVGKRGKNELIGYYGEKLVLECMNLGINTCWVALTYKHLKLKYNKNKGEKFYVLISFGYGKSNGVKHKNKDINVLSNVSNDTPSWFNDCVTSCMLAPTAMNQQKFYIKYINDNKVIIKRRFGFYSLMDLGIIKYHYDIMKNTYNNK